MTSLSIISIAIIIDSIGFHFILFFVPLLPMTNDHLTHIIVT